MDIEIEKRLEHWECVHCGALHSKDPLLADPGGPGGPKSCRICDQKVVYKRYEKQPPVEHDDRLARAITSEYRAITIEYRRESGGRSKAIALDAVTILVASKSWKIETITTSDDLVSIVLGMRLCWG